MSIERQCGCKGIRTCLLCEKANGFPVESSQTEKAETVYTYCSNCNLCWPDDEDAAPLYLGRLTLGHEFLSEEEQYLAMSEIDSIPWTPSQSGRRKQDFGPKVNFKKKKVKIGDFRGFPKFTDYIIQRIRNVPCLRDFQPVELCHLEYSPERGSSIDPHVDDFWLWGERLVTVNLYSSTVLTLTPFSNSPCKCQKERDYFSQIGVYSPYYDHLLCDHKFRTAASTEISLKSLNITDKTTCQEDLGPDNVYSTQNSEGNSDLNGHHSPDCECTTALSIPTGSRSSTIHPSGCNVIETEIESMCNLFRMADNESKATVHIELPPRSVFVLAGCVRYNWLHEIKRQDVGSRRLAMTFRELTAEFLDGGKESQFGKELLSIANNFIDF